MRNKLKRLRISFDDFVVKYLGKYIDFDQMYGRQCVDLVRAFLEEVLGIPGYTIPGVQWAWQLFANFPDKGTQYFDKIYKTEGKPPVKGDIIIWKPLKNVIGRTGHVAIFWGVVDGVRTTFDQNFPPGSRCHLQEHTEEDWEAVDGWLRPKKLKGCAK